MPFMALPFAWYPNSIHQAILKTFGETCPPEPELVLYLPSSMSSTSPDSSQLTGTPSSRRNVRLTSFAVLRHFLLPLSVPCMRLSVNSLNEIKMIAVHRTTLRRRILTTRPLGQIQQHRIFHQTQSRAQEKAASQDPRLSPEGDVIEDEFASLREDYQAPRNPIVLAHGLFGFDEIHPVGRMLPGVQYWSGIEEALATKGIEVITATVPPSGRIEVRAQRLAEDIEMKAKGKAVNIIA